MDYLDAIFNFLNIFDNSHYIKKDYNALIDKNEYLGKRILSFLSILITIIAIVFFIYIIYLLLK
jgi:hypothetical protein